MNRTFEAVKRQLGAMGGVKFEVGLLKSDETADGRPVMILRTYKRQDVLQSVARFKFENCRGANVFIRPAGEHNLSMVDDLTGESIRRMTKSGFAPALVVETSPGNFQAWLKHPRILPKELSTAVARSLANEFGGDVGAADWRHFGRLAGFTNRKPRHQGEDGLFPFVMIREASGTVYDVADRFISEVESKLIDEKDRWAKVRHTARSRRSQRPLKGIETFRANPAYAGDGTRIDLAYAIYALSRGASVEQLEEAIRGRDLSHKGSAKRQADYVARTIRKAVDLVNES